jgi:hypothetical protein
MTGSKKSDEAYEDEEAIERREAALKRMLSTPHKPHSESKIGKRKKRKPRKSKKAPSPA